MTHTESNKVKKDIKKKYIIQDPYEEINNNSFDQCFKHLNDNYTFTKSTQAQLISTDK